MSRPKRHNIGIDVGLGSIGLVAFEVDDSDSDPLKCVPRRLLCAPVLIHDAGTDPSEQGKGHSRKRVSGEARRARTRLARRRKRLDALDALLASLGYPIEDGQDAYEAWRDRARCVEGPIADDTERRCAVSRSLRHIARHPGWRSAYAPVGSLDEASRTASRFYMDYLARQQKSLFALAEGRPDMARHLLPGASLDKKGAVAGLPDYTDPALAPERPTQAQLALPFLDPALGTPVRRHRKRDTRENPYLGKLHQSDLWFEAALILRTQGAPEEEAPRLLEAVFDRESPRAVGAAAKLVAPCSIDPSQKRATRASVAFQEARVLQAVANLRVVDRGGERPLAGAERTDLTSWLTSPETALADPAPTWSDVADRLGVPRRALRGAGKADMDGEALSAARPPVVATHAAMMGAGPHVRSWWQGASPMAREALVDLCSNAGRCLDAGEEAEAELDALLASLDEAEQAKLDSLDLEPGRAAYGVETLQRINAKMLEPSPEPGTALDFHAARRDAWSLPEDWAPAPAPLGSPVGQPAADLVLKEVARQLRAAERRWGPPAAVTIEHVRGAFNSEETKRVIDKENKARRDANARVDEEVRKLRGTDGPVSRSERVRLEAIQTQGGVCPYCGEAGLTFQTSETDHVVPRAGVGSSNARENLVACCRACNESKGRLPFSAWAAAGPREGLVSLEGALKRVDSWMKPADMSPAAFRRLKAGVKERMRRTELDPPLDARSMEQVAWMARELASQVKGAYPDARVRVLNGRVTALARSVGELERAVPWIGGGRKKTRLDRRHHAVDAAAIACLPDNAATALLAYDAWRIEAREAGETVKPFFAAVGDLFGDGRVAADVDRWADEVAPKVAELMADAMREGSVAVHRPLRLRPSNGKAHDDLPKPLVRRPLGAPLSAAAIDKAETPALWAALTSLPDYDPEKGLPADPGRTVVVNGHRLRAGDRIGFLAHKDNPKDLDTAGDSGRAGVAVRGGWCPTGGALHHARVYLVPEGRGWAPFMLRVFSQDLPGTKGASCFTAPLPPSSVSVRSAKDDLRRALSDGTAVYIGWVVPGDELRVDLSGAGRKGAISRLALAARTLGAGPLVVCGFPDNYRVVLRPSLVSEEGLIDPRTFRPLPAHLSDEGRQHILRRVYRGLDADGIAAVNKAVKNGVRIPVSTLFSLPVRVVRRDALGFERTTSRNSMPCSWEMPDPATFDPGTFCGPLG